MNTAIGAACRIARGAGGWMHYSLLSGNRTVIVEDDRLLDLRRRPSTEAPVAARLEPGVVAWLGECGGGWCELRVEGADGWAETAALWGVGPDEVRD